LLAKAPEVLAQLHRIHGADPMPEPLEPGEIHG
jgi:hypothetical protein